MNLKVEHGIIALLLIAFLYYFFTHQSLLSDLSSVPDNGNPQLKAVKGKHSVLDDFTNFVDKNATKAYHSAGDAAGKAVDFIGEGSGDAVDFVADGAGGVIDFVGDLSKGTPTSHSCAAMDRIINIGSATREFEGIKYISRSTLSEDCSDIWINMNNSKADADKVCNQVCLNPALGSSHSCRVSVGDENDPGASKTGAGHAIKKHHLPEGDDDPFLYGGWCNPENKRYRENNELCTKEYLENPVDHDPIYKVWKCQADDFGRDRLDCHDCPEKK